MIILTEVAKKLSAILNGTDTEVSGITNPTNFLFEVQTAGFHLDSVVDSNDKRNFIPVFIDSMGGQFNPIKKLKNGSYSIPVAIYFPVRFKNDFYVLGSMLEDVFVGAKLDYGTISGRAVSNISIPQFTEIIDLDLKEFQKWVEDCKYSKPISVMEPYLCMKFTLFLTTAKEGILFGNDTVIDFSFTYNGTTYSIKDVMWDGSSLQSNTQPQSEQEEGTNESDSVPFGTSYASSFKVYPDISEKAEQSTTENPIYFYKELLKIWLEGNIQEVECEVAFTLGGDSSLCYRRKCFVQSIVAPIEKGQIFSITLTFAKIYEEESEE